MHTPPPPWPRASQSALSAPPSDTPAHPCEVTHSARAPAFRIHYGDILKEYSSHFLPTIWEFVIQRSAFQFIFYLFIYVLLDFARCSVQSRNAITYAE